jgi:protocatechuate 3,4-dioxygenase beta subunit
MREQIPELIGDGLSAEKAVELEQHRSQCPACNEYFEALQADDRLLSEFAQAMQPSVARLENIAIDELGRRQWNKTAGQVSLWRRIIASRLAKIAAVLALATTLIGVAIVNDPGGETVEVANQQDEPRAESFEPPDEDKPDPDAVLADEMGKIREMFDASDVAGLVAMLSDGLPQTKLATANYLAQIGNVEAIGALERLSAGWQGDAADNPYAQAISQIITRLQQQTSEPNEQESETLIAETTPGWSEEGIDCKGVVIDEQGRPIGGARVLLYYSRSEWGLGNRVVEETVSAADGTFVCREMLEFSSIKIRSDIRDTYILMATHPDHAFGWHNITKGSEQSSYSIVLTSPTSRTITVVDDEGNPLAGVRVWPSRAGDTNSPKAVFRDHLLLASDAGLVDGTTDAEGLVVITNLPDTSCTLHTTLEGYATGVANADQDTVNLSKGASISGWVLAEGGEPVAGAIIGLRGISVTVSRFFLAVTDDDGYFRLDDLPAKGWVSRPSSNTGGVSGLYTITAHHEQYAVRQSSATLLPGQSVDDLIIEAYGESTLVECTVVESGTDVPVAGGLIRRTDSSGPFSRGYSDPEGVFRVRVLRGRTTGLSFYRPPDGTYVLYEQWPTEWRVRIDAEGDKMAVTLKTPPIAGLLRDVKGIVFGPDGTPYGEAETVVHAGAGRFLTSTASREIRPAWVGAGGRFELKEVPAGRRVRLYVVTKDQTLAATDIFDIPDDPDWSDLLEMRLEATQSASVLVTDNNGDVIADTRFRIEPMGEGEPIPSAGRYGRTDENGLLEMDGVVPGLEYHLRTIEPRTTARVSGEAKSTIVSLTMILLPLGP